MYSGRPLDIEKLSDYQVDHILPQSYIKDDSLDNKALVIMEENQRKKDNLLLSDEIIDKQKVFWKFLFEKGLISQGKFEELLIQAYRTDLVYGNLEKISKENELA